MLELGHTPLEFSDGIRRLLGLVYVVEGGRFIVVLRLGRGVGLVGGMEAGEKGGVTFGVIFSLCEVLWVFWCEEEGGEGFRWDGVVWTCFNLYGMEEGWGVWVGVVGRYKSGILNTHTHIQHIQLTFPRHQARVAQSKVEKKGI
ncbi:hypothetical protein GMDG_05365 [Pseudogymnoascus destructans 20631-21]|uniref:Uncharacterized protein n=1 Tax=Pseudogymnoascus destructans (strain ATCC MYA-4855 / 20631-21) TaxID=658429 RepID=L8FRF9_PSED2|nr:hypothetical protein GMDG_05365 [Pseudogymnoascus destructans 20631-21]